MFVVARLSVLAALAVLPLLNGSASAQTAAGPASYLYVWTGDADKKEYDFLAVLDVRQGSPTYARVVSTLPVDTRGSAPHHTEHQLEPDRILFANGFDAGRTWRFDLSDPGHPKVLGSFTEVGGYSFPHSFVRLANGHLLVTFQGRGPGNTPPGGLVELDREGRLVRASSARTTEVDTALIRPYSLAVLPAIDRVVSTSTDMLGKGGAHIQVWRFSDLALLQTIALPATAEGDGHVHDGSLKARDEAHHFLPGEPRVLPDGRTVLLATFTCGFYRVTGIDGAAPKVEFLRAFAGVMCAVPVIAGPYWLQTVPDEHALVALDVTDSGHPREVARVTFDAAFKPHWLALDEGGSRVVVNDGKERVILVGFDRQTGALTIDSTFRDEGADTPGVTFVRGTWPHGESGPAKPHGSVFGGVEGQ